MRRRWPVLFTLVATLAGPSIVLAQGGGSIDGLVTDQSGNPLRGVRIEAQSEAQIGKGRRAYTNAEGTFHIGGLTPAKFKVTATSKGLQTVVQDKVEVGITAPAEVNIVMDVETAQRTMVIIEKAPVISTTKAGVKQSYDTKLVESIPFRDVANQHRDVMHSAPGTINLRVRGGGVDQTIFLEDGFWIKNNFPPIRSAQAFEAQTAAYGADAPTASGGVSNLVTRSGSNKFQFEFSLLNVGSWGEFFKDRQDPDKKSMRWVINPTVSGPILKDRLWYHANFEIHLIWLPNPRDPLLILPEGTKQFQTFPKLVTKLSWQATPRNKIDLVFNGDTPYYENRITTPGVSPEAQEDRMAGRFFTGLTWESLLTEKLLFTSKAGWVGYFQDVYPANCRTGDSETCKTIPQVKQTLPTTLLYANGPQLYKQDSQSIQFINMLEWFLSTASAGEHKLRVKDFLFWERDEQSTQITGDSMYEYAGAIPTYRTEYYANDPRLEPGQPGAFVGTTNAFQHVLTLSDMWKPIRRVTAIPALSFVQASASNNKGTFPVSSYTFAPGASVVWDVTGDGKNVLRTSASIYVDVDLARISRYALGSQVSLKCGWNATTQKYDTNCAYSGGASSSKVGDLKIPRTWEATLGGSRELVKGVAFGVDAVYRKFTNQFEDYETNRIWNQSGTGLLGYANGQSATATVLETYSNAERRYFGVSALLTKTEGNLRLESSYTWSRLDGTVLDGNTNYYGQIPAQDRLLKGPLADDHRHEIKINGNWQIQPWLSSGFRYFYYSGTPRYRLFFNNVTGGSSLYGAGPGIDPGSNINDPADDLQIRLPDQQDLNVQIRLSLEPFIKQDLSFFVHVLNILALRTPLTMGQGDGRDFGLVLTRMEPFRIRVGFDYKW